MLIKRFSKVEEETDNQKKKRKKATRMITRTGIALGGTAGLISSDIKSDKIRNKGSEMARKVSADAQNDLKRAEKWTRNAMNHAKNPSEVLNYAEKKMKERTAKAAKDIDRIHKVANASANKATLKGIGKGAAIGAIVAAPLAMHANKRIKESNEKLNAKRRSKK